MLPSEYVAVLGVSPATGCSEWVASHLPAVTGRTRVWGDSGDEGPVCLSAVLDDDVLLELPCKHALHVVCARRWLRQRNRCPLCTLPVVEQEDVCVLRCARGRIKRIYHITSSSPHLIDLSITHRRRVRGRGWVERGRGINKRVCVIEGVRVVQYNEYTT